MFALAQLTEIAPDSGTPGYVTAAVVVSAVLVLLYLVIVAFRVLEKSEAGTVTIVWKELQRKKSPYLKAIEGN